MSPARKSAELAPASRHSLTTEPSSSARRAESNTRALRRESASASSRPMPLEAPVMMTRAASSERRGIMGAVNPSPGPSLRGRGTYLRDLAHRALGWLAISAGRRCSIIRPQLGVGVLADGGQVLAADATVDRRAMAGERAAEHLAVLGQEGQQAAVAHVEADL